MEPIIIIQRMDQQQNGNTPQPQGPMVFKVSLKHHSPEQIYDYVLRCVGELGMKIKKRQAIIGFQTPQLYNKLLRENKTIMLHGKRLEFIPIPKAQENYIQSEPEDVIQIQNDFPSVKPSTGFPEFKSRNEVQAKINSCRLSMFQKVEQLFHSTIDASRQRVQQLKLQYKEAGPCQRQINSLECAVQKKLTHLQTRYEAQILKINKFINDFSLKAKNIDLQPTFQFQDNWRFPTIPYKNMKFDESMFLKNKDLYPCKRLCAINKNEFAVSMSSANKGSKGFAKIYNVEQADPKKSIPIDTGAYGICRVNNYLLVGSLDNTIKYTNLNDESQQVDTTRLLTETFNTSFFELKKIKQSVDRPVILALNSDGFLRKFELTFDQISQGIQSINFDQQMQINVQKVCLTFQLARPSLILYGGVKKVKQYQFEKQKQTLKEIVVQDKVMKIKKFNDNLFAVASTKVVQMIDLRTQKTAQSFPHMANELRCIQIAGQHSIFYGANGEIGLLDDRKDTVFPWKSVRRHTGIVYDILALQNKIISCDSHGLIFSWGLSNQGEKVAGNKSSDPIPIQIDSMI